MTCKDRIYVLYVKSPLESLICLCPLCRLNPLRHSHQPEGNLWRVTSRLSNSSVTELMGKKGCCSCPSVQNVCMVKRLRSVLNWQYIAEVFSFSSHYFGAQYSRASARTVLNYRQPLNTSLSGAAFNRTETSDGLIWFVWSLTEPCIWCATKRPVRGSPWKR